MVKPASMREAAGFIQTEFGISQRRACRLLALDRASCRYRSRRLIDSEALRVALRRHAAEWRHMGYRGLLDLVRADGFTINHKRMFRIYKAEGLVMPRRKRRRKEHGPRRRLELPEKVNQLWAMDFTADQLANGRRFRTLNVLDVKTRECLSIEVGSSLTGTQVCRVLDRIIALRGIPEVIVCDNGPEFAGHVLANWAKSMGIRLHFIAPGKPTENAFIESFNSIFRRECLNEQWFLHLEDARAATERWRQRYNELRPHGSLGKLPPAVYSQQLGLTPELAE